MGKRNEYGKEARCNHCNYIWLYNGDRSITSCPKCLWRVRVEVEKTEYKRIPEIDDITLTPEKRELQKRIRYNSKLSRELYKKQKIECLSHFSHGEPKCSYPGCNITDIDVLTLDHINGNGSVMRREHKLSGNRIYAYLIKQNFPSSNEYRVLCFNHNFKEAKRKGFFGRCKQYEKPPTYPT